MKTNTTIYEIDSDSIDHIKRCDRILNRFELIGVIAINVILLAGILAIIYL